MDKYLLLKIFLIFVIVSGNGYLVYSFVPIRPELPDLNDAEPEEVNKSTDAINGTEGVKKASELEEDDLNNTIYNIKSIGLEFSLPNGWTAERTETLIGDMGAVMHTLFKDGNDLSVKISLRSFRGGFELCEGYKIYDEEPRYKILVSERIPGYDKYHIVGFKKIGSIEDYGLSDSLFISNSSDSNWYDSSQTSYINETMTANLIVGELYTTCIREPWNGMALTSPIAPNLEGRLKDIYFPLLRIRVNSASDDITSHMESNSSELDDILSILKSIKPIE